MKVDLRYLGHSKVSRSGDALDLRFQPNLSRPPVFFDAEVANAVRFREAVSALHAVVVGDLRRKPRDRTAWLAWKEEMKREDAALFERARREAKQAELDAARARPGPPPNLDEDFRKQHGLYWKARRAWAAELARQDPELFRHLVPCDPVVTVADDVVFFECFSKDESSYGCLSVDRDAFRGGQNARPGTTNVDYSLPLYEHFQTLRSYRPTRLLVDPTGFEVKVEGRADLREEKIDLPPSWLRGFGQLGAALGLPARVVTLPVESVHAVLAYLKRHRERQGPRSLAFELEPGRPPVVTIEPWGARVASHGPVYGGDKAERIQVWGRRRLFALARVLPLADRVEVRLLGSGLPSVWTAFLGEMRFVVALSGWTANDWTGAASLELLGTAADPDPGVVETLRMALARSRRATLDELERVGGAGRAQILAAMHRLAREGQAIFDFAAGVYRWREVVPAAISEAVLGPPPPEVAAAPALARAVTLERDEPLEGRRVLVARVGGTACEAVLDRRAGDEQLKRARCTCSYFHKNGLRRGPCRHLIALRMFARLS